MPPPSNQRAEIEPPEQVTTEAVKGFATGALRFGAMSILAHMILIMPHPFTFDTTAPPAAAEAQQPPRRPSSFSPASIRNNFVYRPLASLSESLAPASRIYRGLTPQFKTFLQIAVMTLGGFWLDPLDIASGFRCWSSESTIQALDQSSATKYQATVSHD
ncbi:hypothetical protein T310_1437 [Rasamsonia emersonii CBS 393.64]|uniref:Uncharacterized protein n=1 Tax=Rasamsonia emersonii (strain ATCC 16479 / CBS 393.64 / IMI 116815) TaxID=1408163 RepID=A0A0F4Z368_RASE3|nr:hypothetical protein T310_1437 [Rasamsonia emersonii CBS 393.64]KKA24536.1 hypothetical protein T310_1437 [Rasamsonia emersonii CBS 393.64]